jgi:hypothetical protein
LEVHELTPVELDLLRGIRRCAGADGAARSLFDVAVRHAGLDYPYALSCLNHLERLGYVRVQRAGAGRPLVIWPVSLRLS